MSEPGDVEPVDQASTIERINSKKATQMVRFSCSEISGIAGYNPRQDEILLLEKYVYQDMDELKQLDADNLGIEIITAEEEIDLMLEQFNAEDRKRLKDIEKKIEVAENLNSNAKAHEFLNEISAIMKEESVLSRVSSIERSAVEEEFLKRIKMGYGVSCEDVSLNKYECLTGFSVVERNMQYIKMKVLPPEEPLVEVDPANVFNTLIAQSKKISELQKQYMELASSSGMFDSVKSSSGSSGGGTAVVRKARVAKYKKPAFLLIGRVDGMSYQLDMTSEDPAAWTELKVVVEMKSRVHQIFSPPPLYDQIQLVSYLMILNCSHGDLVQSITDRKRKIGEMEGNTSSEPKSAKVTVKNGNEIHYDDTYSISRVTLDGPPYYHRKHWDEVILPRLRSFHDAVLTMRRDDGLRYSYLLGTPEEKRSILYKLCPFYDEGVQVDCTTTTSTTASGSVEPKLEVSVSSSQSSGSRESVTIDLTGI